MAAPLGDVIAVAIVVLFAVLPFPQEDFRARGILVIAALLPAAALPFRRRWPLASLAIGLACAVGLAIAGIVSPSALIAVAVSAFAVANLRGRLVGSLALGTTALIVFVSNGIALHGDFMDARALQFLLLIVLAGALGDATRSRREYAAAMTERAERAEQRQEEEARRQVAEERVRIARDLHDVVAHQISVISLNAGVASSALENRPERARDALTTIRSASRTVLTDIGALMALLRADGADEAHDLHPQYGVADLDRLLGDFARVGLHVERQGNAEGIRLTPVCDHVAYLAVQEGLTNAHKHGTGGEAEVRLSSESGALLISVINPLSALAEPHTVLSPSGHGLQGLRERVTAVRGQVTAERVGRDFRLDIRIPTDKEATA